MTDYPMHAPVADHEDDATWHAEIERELETLAMLAERIAQRSAVATNDRQ